MNFEYYPLFQALIPETIIIIAAFVLLGLDLLVLRDAPLSSRLNAAVAVLVLGCLGAICALAQSTATARVLDGMLVLDPITRLVQEAILMLTLFTGVISLNTNFTKHIGEYLALLLFAAVGMMLLIGSDNLLLIFLALELTSLPLYALTAFNKSSIRSSEAALKYFLFGSIAAAFTIFGLSLLYGISSEITLSGIANALRSGVEPIFYVALVMTLLGFAFKIAAAPLHFWAPDVYQGAPTPVAAFIASGSKVASFFVLARILFAGFAAQAGSAAWRDSLAGWLPVLAALAIASMVLGNCAAIAQSSVKRLLAYSAIAHAGYALIAIISNGEQALSSLLFYVITYALTALGAFAVVSLVENGAGEESLDSFVGLHRRSPLLSICMSVFVLSLAGIPPLAGFFGKFFVFTAAARGGVTLSLLWLVIAAVATSAISLYYYLQILKRIYVTPAAEDVAPLRPNDAVQCVIVLLALAVITLGCAPDLLLNHLASAAKAFAGL